MRPIKTIMLAIACVLNLSIMANADVLLVQNGQPQATIYVSKTPHSGNIEAALSTANTQFATATISPLPVNPFTRKEEKVLPLQTAVEELNYHLQKMSGAQLPVIQTDNPADVKGNAIVLGDLAVKMGASLEKTTQSKEGFRLRSKDNTVLIGGESDDGTLFGTYRLLHKLGCDWVMPGAVGEVIPQQSTVKILSVDETSYPGFPVRIRWTGHPRYSSAQDLQLVAQWLRRSGKGDYFPQPFSTGSHYWPKFIKKHQKEFDANPDMYALVRQPDGTLVRTGPQIDTTNPKVIELMVQDIKNAFKENNWPNDKEVGFPFLGPADGAFYSLSPEAQNASANYVDPISGSPDATDLLVLLGNTILEKTKKDFPNIWLGFYSYSNHEDYPRRYKPDPRLVITFAPYYFSHNHSLLDPRSKTKAYYRSVVEKWGALAQEQNNPLIYRGYNFRIAELFAPFVQLGIWKDEIPFYHQMKFLGLNVEASNNWANFGMGDYMLMQLAWNPNLDWQQALDTYCQNAFGAGAPHMKSYFLRLMDRQSEAGQEAMAFSALHLIYTPEIVEASKKDLQLAQNSARGKDEKTRIQYAVDGFKSLEIYLQYHQAMMEFKFSEAQKYFAQLIAHQKSLMKTNSLLASEYASHQLNRFVKDFSAVSAQYSTGDYQVKIKLPDQLKTFFDAYRAGEEMKFFDPMINDSNWVSTKTYSTTWDDQGITVADKGSVWYRYHFDAVDTPEGSSTGLLLGGYNDSARVWINGTEVKPIAAPPVYGGLMKPAVYDITAALKPGAKNVLAVEITKDTIATFYGIGGLIHPSFIFTGPRLSPATE